MDQATVTIIATVCVILGILVGRTTKSSTTFDPFTYYRMRIRQITDSAEKQSDIQTRIQSFDKAWSEIFDTNK